MVVSCRCEGREIHKEWFKRIEYSIHSTFFPIWLDFVNWCRAANKILVKISRCHQKILIGNNWAKLHLMKNLIIDSLRITSVLRWSASWTSLFVELLEALLRKHCTSTRSALEQSLLFISLAKSVAFYLIINCRKLIQKIPFSLADAPLNGKRFK